MSFKKILSEGSPNNNFVTRKDVRVAINNKEQEMSQLKKEFKQKMNKVEKELKALYAEKQKLKG